MIPGGATCFALYSSILTGLCWTRETCVRKCVQSQFTRFRDRLPSVGPEKFVSLFSALDRRGYVPKKAVYEAMGLEPGIRDELAAALSDDYFQTYPKFCAGFRNVLVTLATLKERGMKLVIVTNGAVAFSGCARSATGDRTPVRHHCDLGSGGREKAGIRAIWKRDDYWGACPFTNAVIDELDELPGALRLLEAS